MLADIGAEAAKAKGFIARRVTRPQDHDRPEYVVVFKFASYADLRGWTESDARKAWLEKVKPLVLDVYKETALTGLETWFTVPGQPGTAPPPRYKMAAVTFAVVYPLSYAMSAWLVPQLGGLPRPLQAAVTSAVMIFLMTWVLMPRATWLFKRWLFAR